MAYRITFNRGRVIHFRPIVDHTYLLLLDDLFKGEGHGLDLGRTRRFGRKHLPHLNFLLRCEKIVQASSEFHFDMLNLLQ